MAEKVSPSQTVCAAVDWLLMDGEAQGVPLAVAPKAVSTFPPFLAFTLKVYSVPAVRPVTVFVPQTAAVCHKVSAPNEPLACTYWSVTVSKMANWVVAGFAFTFTATLRVVAVGVLTVGAAGTLASVQKSTLSP